MFNNNPLQLKAVLKPVAQQHLLWFFFKKNKELNCPYFYKLYYR